MMPYHTTLRKSLALLTLLAYAQHPAHGHSSQWIGAILTILQRGGRAHG